MNVEKNKRTNVRYIILFFLFIATVFNYADRATLSVVAPFMSKELNFDPGMMGFAFSAFGISYVIMQIPGGWLLDKYGSRLVYGCALIGWSLVTMLQGTIYLYASPLMALIILRLLMGAIEAPAFPANSRLSVQWFPNSDRGFVTSIYQSAQYISLALITPLMTFIVHMWSWHYVFYYIGLIGVVLGGLWLLYIRDPLRHKSVNKAEIDYIREGGGVPELGAEPKKEGVTFAQIKKSVRQQNDDWRVYRTILFNLNNLVLPDVVSHLPVSGEGNVDTESRYYCLNPCHCWFYRWHYGGGLL